MFNFLLIAIVVWSSNIGPCYSIGHCYAECFVVEHTQQPREFIHMFEYLLPKQHPRISDHYVIYTSWCPNTECVCVLVSLVTVVYSLETHANRERKRD